MRFPSTENDWLKIATEFEELWHCLDCIGLLDGKHIALFHPLSGGSNYYNYRSFHSIFLIALTDIALTDTNYEFLYVDIGCQGRLSDGAVYRNCSFNKPLQQIKLRYPQTGNSPTYQYGRQV